MKKGTNLILTCALVLAALVVSVQLVQTYVAHSPITHDSLVADCGDPPVVGTPGE